MKSKSSQWRILPFWVCFGLVFFQLCCLALMSNTSRGTKLKKKQNVQFYHPLYCKFTSGWRETGKGFLCPHTTNFFSYTNHKKLLITLEMSTWHFPWLEFRVIPLNFCGKLLLEVCPAIFLERKLWVFTTVLCVYRVFYELQGKRNWFMLILFHSTCTCITAYPCLNTNVKTALEKPLKWSPLMLRNARLSNLCRYTYFLCHTCSHEGFDPLDRLFFLQRFHALRMDAAHLVNH